MDNTTTITFRSQSRSVSVKAPASGYRANPEINQKVSVSGGGTIYTTDFGGETQKLQVQLRRLTRTEYAALKEFILTTCRGSAFSFDLTDYQGTHQNLHYISGLEGAELHRGDLFNVTLQLQKSTDQSIRLEQNLITNPNLTVNPDGRTIDGWAITDSERGISAALTPPVLRNVDISEDFGTRALEIVDNDRNTLRVVTSNDTPIIDLRYTVRGRVSRVAGERLLQARILFKDEVGNILRFFVFGQILGGTPSRLNDTWNLYSVVFGPGSNTPVPSNSKSFSVDVKIAPVSQREPFATALRLADFSVVVSL